MFKFKFKAINKNNKHIQFQVNWRKDFFIVLSLLFVYSSFSQTVQTGIQNTCYYIDDPYCVQSDIPVRTRTHYTYSQQIVSKERIIEGGWSSNMEYITRLRYYINNPYYIEFHYQPTKLKKNAKYFLSY